MIRKLSKPVHKAAFYARNQLRSLVPGEIWRARRHTLLAHFERLDPRTRDELDHRVAYYNRLTSPVTLDAGHEALADFRTQGKSSAYCADFQYLARHFPRHLRLRYRFGDITDVPGEPTFVKSRPIGGPSQNANSLLLKLNSVRHYRFFHDRLAFRDKKPLAVWRGKSNRDHRIEFAQRFLDLPQCDIGCTIHKERTASAWHKPFLTIEEQLGYQFIVSVEGVDVATNLKWIMASNSLCLMRRPRYETWFMEGTLVPGIHYVELKDDHSDLPEKVAYYRRHPREAEAIIANAQRHARRFMDRRQEDILGLLVMERYFRLTGQTLPVPMAVTI